MKTITIHLSDVEAAMLVEVQKRSAAFRDIPGLLRPQIRQEFRKMNPDREF